VTSGLWGWSHTAQSESGHAESALAALLTDAGSEAMPISALKATAVWSVDFLRWPRAWPIRERSHYL
jgi:hypothetical protein